MSSAQQYAVVASEEVCERLRRLGRRLRFFGWEGRWVGGVGYSGAEGQYVFLRPTPRSPPRRTAASSVSACVVGSF